VAQSPNLLLASLSPKAFATVEDYLKVIDLARGDVLAQAGTKIQWVYFPYSCVIALVVELSSGKMIETAMVGRDGVLNAAAAFEGKVSLNKAIVQLAGTAAVIEADQLRLLTDKIKPFTSLLIRHKQVMSAESQQSVACTANHTIEARMCRWLLRMRDLADSDNLPLTQDFLAQILGVQRQSVSVGASALQKAGLIKYQRGHIRILNVKGLRDASCECYGTVKAHYKRLLVA
jgi:CRP-like cAMP-binding protein